MVKFYKIDTKMPTNIQLGVSLQSGGDRVLVKYLGYYNAFPDTFNKKNTLLGPLVPIHPSLVWEGGFVLAGCGIFKEVPYQFFLTSPDPLIRSLSRRYRQDPQSFILEARGFKKYREGQKP